MQVYNDRCILDRCIGYKRKVTGAWCVQGRAAQALALHEDPDRMVRSIAFDGCASCMVYERTGRQAAALAEIQAIWLGSNFVAAGATDTEAHAGKRKNTLLAASLLLAVPC